MTSKADPDESACVGLRPLVVGVVAGLFVFATSQFDVPTPYRHGFDDAESTAHPIDLDQPVTQDEQIAANPWLKETRWADALHAWYKLRLRDGATPQAALNTAVGIVIDARGQGKLCMPQELSADKKAEVLARQGPEVWAMGMSCQPL